jgi:protein-tyrosine-phosphatase
VLVVCHGNIYRSAFVRAGLAQACLGQVETKSVGFHAVANRPAPPRMVDISRSHGVVLDAHRSSVARRSDLEWADTIILMDRHNWQALMQMHVDSAKCVWLGTLDGHAVEIPDPEAMDDVSLHATVARLADCTRRLAAAIAAGNSS